ncbi:MAG: amidohydrolase family protein [Desulfobacterales bacterium]|nr:amidohydrolase family protein [Desulfobacterales bacterium]
MDLILRKARINDKLVDIGILNKMIVKVQSDLPDKGTHEIEGNGRVAIPGFVDCHLHLDKCLLNEKSPYQDLSGPEKGALTRARKANFTVNDIKERAEKIILQGIKAGNLVIRTNVDVDPIVGLQGIEALLELKEKYKNILDIQVVAFAQEGLSKFPETVELLDEAIRMGANLVGGHTIVDGNLGKEHIDKILILAKKHDIEAEFHLDESGNKEHYLLPYLAEKMITEDLVGRVSAIHCCTLSALDHEERKRAIQLMKKARMKVTIAPTAISTRALAPVKELIAADIIIGLGSDNIRDFFNPLGSGDIKQVALLLSFVQRFFTDEEIKTVWHMITSEGAKLLGCKDYDIFEGKAANITLLEEKTPKEVIARGAAVAHLIRSGMDYSEKINKMCRN